MQNFDWGRKQEDFTPTFIKGYDLEYSFTEKNIFRGGYEYRNLDLKSFQYKTMNVKEYILETPLKTILNGDAK